MSSDGDEGGLDLSMGAVNKRLRRDLAEHRDALARGDPRALRESDQLLASIVEDSLTRQAEAARKLAEIDAQLERLELDRRGGRLQ